MIGILTFHRTTNYGAALQALALQHVLEKKGFSCEIIDYRCEAVEDRYRIIKRYDSVKDYVKAVLLAVPNHRLKRRFAQFSKEKFNLSEPVMPEEFEKAAEKYSCIIVGSDQVWNPLLTGGDNNYYLPFRMKGRKVSYAASFGSFKDGKVLQEIQEKYISDFYEVSLREKSVLRLVPGGWKRDPVQTLDPTLLLSASQWKTLLVKRPMTERKYILVYKMMDAEELFPFAKKLAAQTGLELIYITHSVKYVFGMKNLFNVSPEEFITWMYHAEYVVTSSFHGVALSVALQKNFFYALDQKETENNSRICSLIELCGLEERCTSSVKELEKPVDWKMVEEKMMWEREKSLRFLFHAVADREDI